jgi:hypothetical protein
MRAFSCLAFVFLVACDKAESVPWDADGDGFKNDVDCNDERMGIYPDATELCNGYDDDCDGVIDNAEAADSFTYYRDADGDGTGSAEAAVACAAPEGFVADGGDCDDANPEVHPGKSETCNGADDDCDGTVDNSIDFGQPYYPDEDKDGFGVTVAIAYFCEPQAGYVSEGGDCDDRNARAYPGATETCDTLDEDCDGIVDDNPIDGGVYYLDADGDEHGDAEASIRSCVKPGRYLDDATDCDDADGRVYPGADERCNEQDDDCDLEVDEKPVDGTTYFLDGDADGYGDADRALAACRAPENYVSNSLDCDDADDDYHPGVAEACDGVDNDCNGSVDDGEAPDGDVYFRDVDADGFGVASSTRLGCFAPAGYSAVSTDCDDGDASVNPDAAEVCNNGVDDNCNDSQDTCGLSGGVDLEDVASKIYPDPGTYRYLGARVASGDFDGDGYADLLAWESGYYTYTSSGYPDNYGKAYIFYGPLDHDFDFSESSASIVQGYGLSTAYFEAGGDYDGDGSSDLAIGLPYYGVDYTTFTYDYSGRVVGYSGTSLVGDLTRTSTRAFSIAGSYSYSYLGQNMAYVGDVNGDGYSDLAVGDQYYYPGSSFTYNGGVGVFFGPISGDVSFKSADIIASGANYRYLGGSPGTVDGVGDFDGDGFDDFAIVDPGEYVRSSSYGAVYVVADPALSGTVSSLVDAKVTMGGTGTDYTNLQNVSGVDDVNGDGYSDFAVGSPYSDNYAGRVYIMAGGVSSSSLTLVGDAIATISGENDYEYFGQYQIRSVGDVDGDGTQDLGSTSSYVDSDTSTNVGGVYIFTGPFDGDLSAADATAEVYTSSGSGMTYSGSDTFAAIGDPGDDGYADIAFGVPYLYQYDSSTYTTYYGGVMLIGGAGL